MVRHVLKATIVALSLIVCLGTACSKEMAPSGEQRVQTTTPAAPTDSDKILAHKIECMKVGALAEKNEFPSGANTVGTLNNGEMHFDSEYAYSEALNTCVVLIGFEMVNLKTDTSIAFDATIKDLLSNKILFAYGVFNAETIAPFSIERATFIAKVRELFGVPIPKWLEIGPHVPTRP